MRIEDIKMWAEEGRIRASAMVIWEDCNQRKREIYFETDNKFANLLAPNPNAFITACIIPAMYLGEKRVKINAKMCPALKEGLSLNMEFLRNWYGTKHANPVIETDGITEYDYQNATKNTASFLSGGIDSLFTLRMNRWTYPINHPASIRFGFLVHGFDIYRYDDDDKKLAYFIRLLKALYEVADDAKITLVPVYTNIRHLYSDVNFWIKWYHGAALSAVAHAFSNCISTVLISSSHYVSDLVPLGSHPLIDNNYSSFEFKITNYGVHFNRFEKTKIIADWDIGIRNIHVCTGSEHFFLNCGLCEKCRRTMLALIALGKLKNSIAFPYRNITNEDVIINNKRTAPFYKQLVIPLKKIGRNDLVRAINRELSIIGDIRRFDRKYLKSFGLRTLRKIKNF